MGTCATAMFAATAKPSKVFVLSHVEVVVVVVSKVRTLKDEVVQKRKKKRKEAGSRDLKKLHEALLV